MSSAVFSEDRLRKRLMREMKDIAKLKNKNITIEPKNDNITKYNVIIIGSDDTPYKNGKFNFELRIPPEYPFKPPVVIMKSVIYHPNIKKHQICLDIITGNMWSPAMTIVDVVRHLVTILEKPSLENPLNYKATAMYCKHIEHYKKIASDLTRKFCQMDSTESDDAVNIHDSDDIQIVENTKLLQQIV